MSRGWHPLGGSGGLPSDMVSSEVVGDRRLKTVAELDQNTIAKTAFNEIVTAERSPITQIMSRNGLRKDVLTTFAGVGASATVTNYKYTVTSGTSPFGFAAINSILKGSYKPGQELFGGQSFVFDAPKEGTLQVAGFITGEDIVGFAYLGTQFGLVVASHLSTEIQELAITSGASGTGNASITINGQVYVVPLVAGSIDSTTAQIEAYFRANPVQNYTITANGGLVTALSGAPVVAGAFAFSSAVAAGAWTQIREGQQPDYASAFIPVEEWDNPPDWDIQPNTGNVGSITLGFYGYKGFVFSLDNPRTGKPEFCHYFGGLNRTADTVVLNPSLSIGWAVQNIGSTEGVTLQGASAAIFNQGKIVFDEPPNSDDNTITTTTTNVNNGQTVNILSIRNRSTYNDTINAVDLYSIVMAAKNESNKDAVFVVIEDPDFAAPVVWEYLDETNSIAELCKTNVVVTGGRRLFSLPVTKSQSSAPINLRDTIGKLTPRHTMTFAIIPKAAGEAGVTVNWKEDQ